MTATRALLPALLALSASATGAAAPLAFTARGVGALGSVLLLAVLAAGAGLVFGAIVAALLADRGADRLALALGAAAMPAGAVLLVVGSGGTVAGLLAGDLFVGIGQGMLYVLALVLAARTSAHRHRPWAIALVLAGVLLGTGAATFLYRLGPPALVGIAVVSAASAAACAVLGGRPRPGRSPRPVAASVGGGLLAAAGFLLLAIGAGESQAIFFVALIPFRGDLNAVDDSRLVLLVLGALALGAGAWLGLAPLRAWAHAWLATGALAAFALVSSAVALPVMMAVAVENPGTSLWALGPAATLVAFVTAAAWIGSRDPIRAPAVLGAGLASAGVVLVLRSWLAAEIPGTELAAGAILLIGLGGGALGVSLRTLLGDASPAQLGSATAAGVLGVFMGAQLGNVVGADLAIHAPEISDPWTGIVPVVAASVIGLLAAIASPSRRAPPAGPAAAPGGAHEPAAGAEA